MMTTRASVALLLIAACGQERIEPKGRARPVEAAARPTLSVLVTDERIYLGATGVPGGTSTETIERGANRTPQQVWTEYDADLATLKRAYFADRNDLELAAEPRDRHVVPYADLVQAMDHATKAGFTDIGLTEPASLSWRPELDHDVPLVH